VKAPAWFQPLNLLKCDVLVSSLWFRMGQLVCRLLLGVASAGEEGVPARSRFASAPGDGADGRVVRLVTWTIPPVINWCLGPYALQGLPPLSGVVRLVTWTIPPVINWCSACTKACKKALPKLRQNRVLTHNNNVSEKCCQPPTTRWRWRATGARRSTSRRGGGGAR
jgi:hypothetical protein